MASKPKPLACLKDVARIRASVDESLHPHQYKYINEVTLVASFDKIRLW